MSLLDRLIPGTRREIGAANDIAAEVAADPGLLQELLGACEFEEDVVRMRAFDALEKAVRANRELAEGAKEMFLAGLGHDWWEVRIQCIRGIGMCNWESVRAVAERVDPLLDDEAKFVRAWAIDTAVQLAKQDDTLVEWAQGAVQMGLESGVPSIIKRAQKSGRELGI